MWLVIRVGLDINGPSRVPAAGRSSDEPRHQDHILVNLNLYRQEKQFFYFCVNLDRCPYKSKSFADTQNILEQNFDLSLYFYSL